MTRQVQRKNAEDDTRAKENMWLSNDDGQCQQVERAPLEGTFVEEPSEEGAKGIPAGENQAMALSKVMYGQKQREKLSGGEVWQDRGEFGID